jgi:C-terminal processing protease CtpA/Prc
MNRNHLYIRRHKCLLLLFLLSVWVITASSAEQGEGPMLGVVVQDVPFQRLEDLGISYGVSVRSVVPASPAATAGIQPDDIVVALDGSPVYSAQRLQWLVSKRPAGEPITLRIQRGAKANGEQIDIEVTPAPATAGAAGQPTAVAAGWAWLGIQMQPLTEALRRRYGVPAGLGVLIADVEANSPAATAKLQAGDVLVRIDRRIVRSPLDVYRALNFFDPGETVELEVMHDAAPKTLEVTLGRREQEEHWAPLRHLYGFPSHSWPRLRLDPAPESWPDSIEGFLELWRPYFWQPWEEPQAPSSSPGDVAL